MDLITFCCIVLICLFVVSTIMDNIRDKRRTIGNLRIDKSDSDGPLMFLELTSSFEEISKHDYVTLRVVYGSYLDPHK